MDKIMHRMGLHGKSFIPMIMGFGCNIPAIMATRTIEDRKSRLITMLIIPLMSCSARLPVYIIIIGAFFPKSAALVLFSMYLTGILFSILMAKLFSRFVVRGESSPFVMELPPYRMPSMKSVGRHTWEKGKQYLKKMGTTILVASIVVWALSYFPHHPELTEDQQMELSYIGQIGKFIEPVIRPCGLAWKEGVALVTGVGAKEIVASTMAVLYHGDITTSGMTSLTAFSFMLFVLLYFPCIPTCIGIKNESGKWKWAGFTALYTTLLAWLTSMIVYQIGSLL
jgi:ferrous iron transport protein B